MNPPTLSSAPLIALLENPKELTLQDKSLFDKYMKNQPNKTAMMNFTSLYIWKDWGGKTTWDIVEDTLCIEKNFRSSVFTLLPLALDPEKFKKAVNTLIERAQKNNSSLCFREVNSEQAAFFKDNWGDLFETRELEDNANYIYRITNLVDLTGKPYSSKRNHINKLLRSGLELELQKIDSSILTECKDFLSSWMESHPNREDIQLISEYDATITALDNIDALGVTGACLRINNEIQGLTLGEQLNNDTVLIHIEKANAALPGAYPYLNQKFLEQYWQNYTYVNREEDMGNPGLRKAKQSYHPSHMESVFILKLI